MELERGRKNNPVLVALEDAFPVAEFAVLIADFADPSAVKEPDRLDDLTDGMAVGAGVSVDRAAHPSRNASHGFQALQALSHGLIDQILQDGSGLYLNRGA